MSLTYLTAGRGQCGHCTYADPKEHLEHCVNARPVWCTAGAKFQQLETQWNDIDHIWVSIPAPLSLSMSHCPPVGCGVGRPFLL